MKAAYAKMTAKVKGKEEVKGQRNHTGHVVQIQRAALEALVEPVVHRGVGGAHQHAAVAQGAGPELHPAVEARHDAARGEELGDPVLEYCEDYMLADEVTHVKMGSRWLREVTANDAERRKAALEFQRVVDGLFNFRGQRGEDEDSPIRLARQFRKMAGFTDGEVDDIAEMASKSRAEADADRMAAELTAEMAAS